MVDFLLKKLTANGSLTEEKVRNKCGSISGITGIICNLLLCTLKIAVGVVSSSISIVADGLNNLSDMGSSVITFLGFKIAEKPADKGHPYGHGRIEYVAAFLVSLLILLVGFELMKESVTALVKNESAPVYTTASAVILFLSVAVKFAMYLFNGKLAKRINSEAIAATAQDSINDCITTTAILISVGASKIFDIKFNLDSVMGIGVALFILFSGLKSSKETMDTILGTPPDKQLTQNIKNCVLSFGTFLGIHDLIIHSYGPNRCFASVHVEVPRDIDIVDCHEKIDICERLVKEKLGVDLVIHMDPIETDNEEINVTKAAILEGLKKIDPAISVHDFRMTPKGNHHTNFIFDVVIPAGTVFDEGELREKINSTAKEINAGYNCIVTFDNEYI